jgi:anti-sigma B factor antagonist
MFNYHLVDEATKTKVIFEGDMDIDGTEIIEQELSPLLLNRKEVEFDFSKVLFVDSSGIGLLITLVTKLGDQGNKVRIVNITPDVKMIFDLLQLPEILGHDVIN